MKARQCTFQPHPLSTECSRDRPHEYRTGDRAGRGLNPAAVNSARSCPRGHRLARSPEARSPVGPWNAAQDIGDRVPFTQLLESASGGNRPVRRSDRTNPDLKHDASMGAAETLRPVHPVRRGARCGSAIWRLQQPDHQIVEPVFDARFLAKGVTPFRRDGPLENGAHAKYVRFPVNAD